MPILALAAHKVRQRTDERRHHSSTGYTGNNDIFAKRDVLVFDDVNSGEDGREERTLEEHDGEAEADADETRGEGGRGGGGEGAEDEDEEHLAGLEGFGERGHDEAADDEEGLCDGEHVGSAAVAHAGLLLAVADEELRDGDLAGEVEEVGEGGVPEAVFAPDWVGAGSLEPALLLLGWFVGGVVGGVPVDSGIDLGNQVCPEEEDSTASSETKDRTTTDEIQPDD